MTKINDVYPLDDMIWQPYSKWIKYLDLSQAVRFEGPFADFLMFVEAHWNINKVELGYSSASLTLLNEVGGVLRISCDTSDNDAVQIQLKGEPYKLVAGKPCWFEAKFRTADPTQVDLLFGLCITDTTLIAGFSDGVVIKKDDGDAYLDFQSVKANTPTNKAAIATLAANAWTKVGFYFNGYDTLTPYIDGVKLAAQKIQTNIPDDEELTISVAMMNGEWAIKSLDIDYIKAVQKR